MRTPFRPNHAEHPVTRHAMSTDRSAAPVGPRRRVDVFFYGLFMDEELLRSKGLDPKWVELATVDDFELRIGERAALAPAAGGRVHGVVASLTMTELSRLYSEPSVQAYKAQAVLVQLSTGGTSAALCYNLAEPPARDAWNPEYASRLRAVALKTGLPAEYIASLDPR
jgi:hypothetical protein